MLKSRLLVLRTRELGIELLWPQMHGSLVLRCTRDDLFESQLLKNAVVQFHLRLPALEEVVVVVLQTLPVGVELFQAVGIDILDHTGSATRNLPTLLQTLHLPSSISVGLALHVIIIVGSASVPDKERRASQRCRSSPYLLHLGDVIGHRRCVNEDMLVKLRFSPGHLGRMA